MKSGAGRIKYHIDYLGWLLDQRRWLAGNEMTLADFTAAAHRHASFISDVDWNRSAAVRTGTPRSSPRPSFHSHGRSGSGLSPPPAHYAGLDFLIRADAFLLH